MPKLNFETIFSKNLSDTATDEFMKILERKGIYLNDYSDEVYDKIANIFQRYDTII